ncbi:hypothetical protein DFH09DRAFT_1092090 [Mycena vulgaris]|nr:hypothetical protein DFH09DRAFT_1092090 [Mycena vulgaris]
MSASNSIARHVKRLQLPALGILNVHRVLTGPDPQNPLSHLDVYHLAATTEMANIHELRLHGSFPKWEFGQSYTHLQLLSLYHMRGSTALTWLEAEALFSTACRLTSLRLDQVECREFPATYDRLPTMHHLAKLSLTISHSSSARLAAAFDMPAARTLNLVAKSEMNVYYGVISDIQGFKLITHLTLIIECTRTDTIRSLLGKIPKLMYLDYRNNNHRMLELFAETVATVIPGGVTPATFCPALTKLIISGRASKVTLNNLLKYRQPAYFSRRLVVHIPGVKSKDIETKNYYMLNGVQTAKAVDKEQ